MIFISITILEKNLRMKKNKKLILNVRDKTNYVVHIRNLEYYLQKGLIVSKINRCIKFNQSKWMKSWIDFNTEKKKKSKVRLS